jgi:hypothetical protein
MAGGGAFGRRRSIPACRARRLWSRALVRQAPPLRHPPLTAKGPGKGKAWRTREPRHRPLRQANRPAPPRPAPTPSPQVNALASAFSTRSDEARAGTEAHRTALGAAALARALEEGRPLERELSALLRGCPEDGVVAVVVESLPASAAAAGGARGGGGGFF